jgi:NTE family protein
MRSAARDPATPRAWQSARLASQEDRLMTKTKVAIACQGGGSQTAFTAGALRAILRDPDFGKSYEVVALSGTSGGAVCCLLTWYGLLAHPPSDPDRGERTARLLEAFWEANSARGWYMATVNAAAVTIHQLQDNGWIGQFPPPGTAPLLPLALRDGLRDLIERFVCFEDIPALLARDPSHPTLLVGAVDVLNGTFAVFQEACPDPDWQRQRDTSLPPAVGIEPVLASAAIPPSMPATLIGGKRYWDGLYAHNPPIRDLISGHTTRPDETWVIQIDPQSISREPIGSGAITDRRFELASNLSLNAEIHWIKQINQWVDDGTLPADKFKTIKVGRVQIDRTLAAGLDLASKINRAPDYLNELMADGEREMQSFLRRRSDSDSDIWEVYPRGYQPEHALPDIAVP